MKQNLLDLNDVKRVTFHFKHFELLSKSARIKLIEKFKEISDIS